jgi:type IV pilus assembly protein PilA
MLKNYTKKKNKGFTLVELIIAVVIIAVLAAIAIPSVASYVATANEGKAVANGRSVYMACSLLGAEAAAKGTGAPVRGTGTGNITNGNISELTGFAVTDTNLPTITWGANGAVTAFEYIEGGTTIILTADGGVGVKPKV